MADAVKEVKPKKEKAEKVKVKKAKTPMSKEKLHKIMFGTKDDMGLLKKIVVYVILTCVGFVFVYPLLKVLSTSFMSLSDLFDSSINWIPSKLRFENYRTTMKAMNYWKSLKDSFIISGLPTGKLMTFIFPAILANGFKSQLFILICWSFFKQIPPVLNEAAAIDGAGHFKSFFKIALPSAAGALIVVLIFSFVWYWNEQYLSQLYLYSKVKENNIYTPLINQLSIFDSAFDSAYNSNTGPGSSNSATINDAYRMAATILTILPLLIIYAVLQKQFVESVDRAGITGE